MEMNTRQWASWHRLPKYLSTYKEDQGKLKNAIKDTVIYMALLLDNSLNSTHVY